MEWEQKFMDSPWKNNKAVERCCEMYLQIYLEVQPLPFKCLKKSFGRVLHLGYRKIAARVCVSSPVWDLQPKGVVVFFLNIMLF